MKLFTGQANPPLAASIAAQLGTTLSKALVSHFADGETRIALLEDVREQTVFLIQSTSQPANDHLMQLLLLADAARHAFAKRIIAVMPYFGYARQDCLKQERAPIALRVVADMLKTVGITDLVTCDLHSTQALGFFAIPVLQCSASALFATDVLQQSHIENPLIISPDVGGVIRARTFAQHLRGASFAIVEKYRSHPNAIESVQVIGDVRNRACVIIDDLIDTGKTVCLAAEALKAHGAKTVTAYVTHPVLSQEAIPHIASSCLEELVVTDTLPLSTTAKACTRIRQLTLAPLLSDSMRLYVD